jgi:hypothetical protein
MKRTVWFKRCEHNPSRPGVYLTRALYSGNEHLNWWRAFDGSNWRTGVMAVDTLGIYRRVAPDYRNMVENPVIGEHVIIEWCGLYQD